MPARPPLLGHVGGVPSDWTLGYSAGMYPTWVREGGVAMTHRAAAAKVAADYAETHERLKDDPEYIARKTVALAEESMNSRSWTARNRFVLYVEAHMPGITAYRVTRRRREGPKGP